MRFVVASIFAALGGMLLAVPSAKADGCRFVRGYSGGYSQGSYGHGVHFAHNQYGHGYHHDAVLIPYVVPVTIVPYTYFAVAPELAYAKINQELADAAARKAVAEFLKGQGTPSSGGRPEASSPNPPSPNPPTPPSTPPSPSPSSPSSPGFDPKALTARVQAHANASCVKCHKADGEAPNLVDVTKLTREDRMEAVYRLMTDDPKIKMPKTGSPPTPEQLNDWHTFVALAPKAASGK